LKKVFALLAAALLIFCLTGSAFAQEGEVTQPSSVFELPIAGASGYAAVELTLYGSGDTGPIGKLNAGQGFTILRETNEWWLIQIDETIGFVPHQYCLINLPDIIPSIVYNNTNTYSSLLKSSGKNIPDITGMALYQAKDFNNRLAKEQYVVATMYGMAPKIAAAQKAALAEGNTLVIYEAFRPADAHTKVYNSLKTLVESDKEVYAGVTGNTYTMGWFLAPAPYNHQRGTAIDVSLATVGTTEQKSTGGYPYTEVTAYTEYTMQTAMHELSKASTIYTTTSGAALSPNITEGSLLLQKYCVAGGLAPLASEWWHFNDTVETSESMAMGNAGWYSIAASHSLPPVQD
jgi:D-alanyl-D-alanine dipeptidase